MGTTFNQISSKEVLPGAYGEISTVNANQGVFDYPSKILIVGQKLAGLANPLTKNIIADPKQAVALFGAGSQISLMIEAALEQQSTIEIHAIAQEDDGASTKASGSILINNAPTVSGIFYLYVAGERLKIGLTHTDDAAAIASKVVAAINDEASLPVVAAVNGGTAEQVDVTAKNAGLCGNEIIISTNFNVGETYPTGFATTITQLSGGTGNPDIEDVLDVIESDWFTDIAMPYTDAENLAVLEAELKKRFGPYGKKDAVAAIAKRGTFSEIYTFTNGRNSPLVSCLGIPVDAQEPSWMFAAALASWIGFWSNQHPARPYKGLSLKGFRAPKTRFIETERRTFLNNGCSTWTVNASDEIVLERLVTMYQVNDAGVEDKVYMDVTTPKTFSRIRHDDNAYISTLYFGESPKVLTENEVAAAMSNVLVTPKTINASSKARSELWVREGWVSEVIDIRAVIDESDPTRVNRVMSLDITNPLHIIATLFDMRV